MAAHRYWRLLIHTNGAGGSNCSVGELVGYQAGFDGQRLSGGTASASSTLGGFPASNAFDGTLSTFWNTASFVDPTWLKYDLGSGVTRDIRQITIWGRQDGFYNQNPATCDWQWSDDDVTYTTAFSLVIPAFTAAGQSFSSPSPGPTNNERTTTGDVLTAINFPSASLVDTQSFALTAIRMPAASEQVTTSVGLVAARSNSTLRTTQSDVLVALLYGAEERMLRAWTFTQDGHDFYVLLAAGETYVYDKASENWCQWASPDANFWRGVDGVDWEGINVCIDPDSGKVYKIDPTGRLDYGTTPVTSVVYGGMTERFRNMPSCYMAEIAISQNSPPYNVDPTTLSITLETTDTVTTWNHGTIYGSATGNITYPRYYGLGLLHSPGVIFKITDTGFARRIDGLNIEISGTSDG
jgi:hypothetical protein